MQKKLIDWETLYGLRDRSHGLRNGFCSNCAEICAPEVCPIWASLEDAPITRIVPPDPKRGEVGPQIVTDLSDGKEPDNEDG